MNERVRIDRRAFLLTAAATAGAASFGFHVPVARADEAAPEVNAWVVIKPDDTVVVRIARSEIGQGTMTGLAQLVAEELECDWTKVTAEFPTPGENAARHHVWGSFSTGGSRGIRDSQDYVRKGGAAARMMLMAAAAQRWNVPAADCAVSKGVITHAASGRSLRYGEVAALAATLPAPTAITLKDPKDWTIAGKPLRRLDTPDKTNGKQIYGIDLKLPGMLIATISACPVFGGKVKSFDAGNVAGMPGVKKVMRVGDNAVAVIADTFYRAKTALAALPIEWDKGENARTSSDDVATMLRDGLTAGQAAIGNENGDARGAIKAAARTVEAVYSYPHQSHATLEPMNATARVTTDRCEVWCPTQNGEAALAAAAAASGLPASQCDVYRQLVGGGFGRRGFSDYVTQAVLIAKEMPGTPVKLIWTREEDMTHDFYHPVTQCRMVGAFDADNNLTALHMRLSGQSITGSLFPQRLRNGSDPGVFSGLNKDGPQSQIGYSFPNLLIDHAMRNPPVPPGYWRGVNNNQNAIYLECFIDELAHAAGQDPLSFRRKLMADHPKHRAVLNAAAEKVRWYEPPPKGVYRGVAQQMGYGSYVAAIAEVSVSDRGQLKIHRIIAATDPGHVVNPAQVERQVAGSFVYGLSAALYGAITIKDGAVEQQNFDAYNVLRLDEMPKVEVVMVPSGGFWGGVGEPTIFVAAPAVLNAIFAATGKRIRHLPLVGQDLRTA
jgi:isoquinoline 1-oxidoreductase beta subunit